MVSIATHYATLKNGGARTVYLVDRYANYLISIFMNINENLRNERKILKESRGVTTKLQVSHLLCVLVYQI